MVVVGFEAAVVLREEAAVLEVACFLTLATLLFIGVPGGGT